MLMSVIRSLWESSCTKRAATASSALRSETARAVNERLACTMSASRFTHAPSPYSVYRLSIAHSGDVNQAAKSAIAGSSTLTIGAESLRWRRLGGLGVWRAQKAVSALLRRLESSDTLSNSGPGSTAAACIAMCTWHAEFAHAVSEHSV